MNQMVWRAGLALLAVAGTAGTAACAQETPIVSRESRATIMTLNEQRDWTAQHLDAAVAASEIADGWVWGGETEVVWSDQERDRAMILESLLPFGCDGTSGRLDVSLINTDAPDPLAAADRVRAFWESEGWTVTDIRDYESPPYFRADREDGAVLSFEAEEGGVVLGVRSACSSHTTVADWRRHLEESEE